MTGAQAQLKAHFVEVYEVDCNHAEYAEELAQAGRRLRERGAAQ